ncbi:conserved hypothetical protein [Vibrio crassostreae]|nr:conserved hypothetical protein [Vibrio crassostreae]CAK3506559.1 conserved hypothetical protein [Vibrio crassostreae]CAK3526971.1 conserved hypothetical protein [Vibrio crassostreae]
MQSITDYPHVKGPIKPLGLLLAQNLPFALLDRAQRYGGLHRLILQMYFIGMIHWIVVILES